jgi:hypothetical protein
VTVIPLHHRQAAEMRAQGMLWKEIAAHFGVTHDTVHRWADPAFNARRNKRKLEKRSSQQSRAAETRWANQYRSPDLPTLAFVPRIELTPQSKYQMARPA